MTPADQEAVRAFRRQARDVRKALDAMGEERRGLRMVDGYIEIEQWLERYRLLCVPVRRTFMEHDRASYRRSAEILLRTGDDELRRRAKAAADRYEEILGELQRESVLGGRRVKGSDMVKVWLDAAVFYDSTDRRKPYDDMRATFGKAIEGLAAEYTEDIARAVLQLDEVAAVALDEPLVLPDPEPVPPPPREPVLRRWWQLFKRTPG